MLNEFRSTYITWDKATSRIYSPVTANASDENGRKLVVQIVNGGQVEDLTGATLHLYWETRDKLHDGLDVFKAVDLKKGEFELSYTTGMLSNHGVLNANLVLIDTVGRVVSERFKITVTEGIDDDAIQSENSFSSLTQALIDISNLEQNYAPILNDLTAQLQQKANQNALDYYWNPPVQPPARQDHEGWFINGYNEPADYYIQNGFEPLRLEHPDYITRENQGKDQSGEYDVWRYALTPKNYKKTIVIQTGTHGGEITPVIVMIRFLHYLCNEWEKYPALADIRENVRIIYTPFVNPWGMSQTPRVRYNSRGVDLNRNFSHLWDSYVGGEPFSQSYKGTAPASEIETQYVMNTLNEFDGITTFLDLHNTGTPSWDYYVPVPQGYAYNDMYKQLFSYFTRDIANPSISNNESQLPTAPNYAYNVLGIPGSGAEWNDTRFGGQVYSSQDLTKALEWFANVIIAHCREFDLNKPIMREESFTFSGTALPLSSAEHIEIAELKGSMRVPCDGVVTYEGFIIVLAGESGGLYNIIPMLGAGSAYNDLRGAEWDAYTNTVSSERIIIPFQASIIVDKRINKQPIYFGLAAKVTSGDPGLIYRYRARVVFTPTDKKNFTSRKINIV